MVLPARFVLMKEVQRGNRCNLFREITKKKKKKNLLSKPSGLVLPPRPGCGAQSIISTQNFRRFGVMLTTHTYKLVTECRVSFPLDIFKIF